MEPLAIFFEFSGPFQWRPGCTSGMMANGRFRRVWWGWFGVAWVRMDLHDYNRHIASGTTEWRFIPAPKPAIVVNPTGFAQPPKPPPPQYRCSECGHVCAEHDMGSDCVMGEDDEIWSSHICPKCHHWHPSLADGWTPVDPP